MDVNGTILWNDSIMGLGPDELLLGTMCGFTEVRPHAGFDLKWDEQPVVRLERTRGLTELVHAIWCRKTFERLLEELDAFAEIGWSQSEEPLPPGEFFSVYEEYMDEVRKQDHSGAACGVTASWFRCLSTLRGCGHSIVTNSFGMDTHRVLLRSVPD